MSPVAPFSLIERDVSHRIRKVEPLTFVPLEALNRESCNECGRTFPRRRRNPKTALCNSCWSNEMRAMRRRGMI